MPPDDTLKNELAKARAECERLRAENARLKVRLEDSPIPAPFKYCQPQFDYTHF